MTDAVIRLMMRRDDISYKEKMQLQQGLAAQFQVLVDDSQRYFCRKNTDIEC